MLRMVLRCLLPVLALSLTGCQAPRAAQPQSAAQPKSKAQQSKEAQDRFVKSVFRDLGGDRLGVEQQAPKYAEKAFPGCEMLGISITDCGDSLFIVGLDLSCKKMDSQTVNLVARRFARTGIPDDAYWKFEPLSAELNQLVIGAVVGQARQSGVAQRSKVADSIWNEVLRQRR